MPSVVHLGAGRRLLRVFVVALLFVPAVTFAGGPPTGGGSPTAAGGSPGAGSGASAGGAPTTPSGFFAPSSINFVRPSYGWVNWSFALDLPNSEKTHAIYLCYELQRSSDASLPYVLKNVAHFQGSASFTQQFPCYSPIRNEHPILRGDRLRVAIDVGTESQAFLQDVSVLNLNVVLNVVPPLQVALLRTNLGATTTAPGIGGNQAPEAPNNPSDSSYQCFLEILGLAAPSGGRPSCTLPKQIGGPPEHLDRVVILAWPFTLPGDVIPSVYVSALYTTPNNGQVWQPNTLYPQGSVVSCPGENVCTVTDTNTQPPGGPGLSGSAEPIWPDPAKIKDGGVTWVPITANFKLGGKGAHTADGRPIYEVGDKIVWTSGQNLIESEVEAWQKFNLYTKNQSVILCPPKAKQELQQLCSAANTGTSGSEPFTTLDQPSISDGGGQFKWAVAADDAQHPNDRWKADTLYPLGHKIRCEQAAQKSNLCIASVGGFSGTEEPWWAQNSGSTANSPSSANPTMQRDNQIVWAPFTPSSATPSADQVVNLGSQELPQVHAPSLWGLSTALLWTTSRIPNSYSFVTTETAGCPTVDPKTNATTLCPNTITSSQKSGDVVLLVSPYFFHHLYSKWNPSAPDGIDTESRWTANRPENWIPEPFVGFGLNSIGNSYYAGLSLEVGVRNLQIIGGRGWIKAPFLTDPVTAAGSSSGSVTPNTYTGFAHAWFFGVAFNIAGLISGH
jgi:hypothetical protein